MKCIFCGSEDNRVLDSRNSDENIRRRRECNTCGRRFTTYEFVEKIPFLVVKRDGSRQSFSPAKLKLSIEKACKKRPVSEQQIENIINDIEKNIQNKMLQEIKSSSLGQVVLNALKEIDKVSCIRYASVFLNFQDEKDFVNFINDLQ